MIKNITEDSIKRFDQNNLYSTYARWPFYIGDSLRLSPYLDHSPGYYKSVVFCGVGGSGTSSDILQEIMNAYGTIPSFTLRGKSMSSTVDERALVIINSVSGNTMESLSMMNDALNHGAEVIAISVGGKIEEESKKHKCKFVRIPNLLLPRASLPYLLVPGLKIIDPFLTKSLKPELSELQESVSTLFNNISAEVSEECNLAKRIARFILGGLPICYTSPYLLPAATRFKASLNENAKLHCIKESILEASHNDVVPLTFDNSPLVPKIIHLRWQNDDSITGARFNKVKSLLQKMVHDVMEVSIEKEFLLSSLVSAVYLLDMSTIYAAINRNTDPSPTPAIQILKDM